MQNGVFLDISNKINSLPIDDNNTRTVLEVQTRILNASPNSQERDTNEINNTDTTLSVNDTFKDWDAVEIAVNTYAKQNGFVAIKSRKDLDAIDKTIVQRHMYSC
ncbi:hypothetical protein C1646_759677 [Rhizophagus diaphanus]|nr:hypothetical protein C1646_759677 [Rhizophagus diaphanus] [Rhizophagus sp. MUCL 43196]